MIEELRSWLVAHLKEGHGLSGDDEANQVLRDSFADLKAAHDLLHESMEDEAKAGTVGEMVIDGGNS